MRESWPDLPSDGEGCRRLWLSVLASVMDDTIEEHIAFVGDSRSFSMVCRFAGLPEEHVKLAILKKSEKMKRNLLTLEKLCHKKDA